MKRSFLTLATCLIAMPGLALADSPCSTTGVSVASLTSCYILEANGTQLNFTFSGGYTGSIEDYTASEGTLYADPNAGAYNSSNVMFAATTNGFQLYSASSNFSSSVGTPDGSLSYCAGDASCLTQVGAGDLSYSVTVTNGTLTGLTTTINGANLVGSPPSPNSDPNSYYEAYATAQNTLSPATGPATVGVQPYLQIDEDPPNDAETDTSNYYNYTCADPSTYPNCTYSDDSYTVPTASYSAGLAGLSTASGVAEIATTADYCGCVFPGGGAASASFTSAEFDFATTSAAVPEPGMWWSLLAMGTLAIIPLWRLQRRRSA